jgi:hypothetical protein
VPVIHIHFDNLTLWALMELKDVAETATGEPMPRTHSLRLALAWLSNKGEKQACENFWNEATKPMNVGTTYMSQYVQGGNLARTIEGIANRMGISNEQLGRCYRALKAGELPEGSKPYMEARQNLADMIRSYRVHMADRPKR